MTGNVRVARLQNETAPEKTKKKNDTKNGFPEGPARQIDVSRQKLSPHCLEATFDSQLPSPKLSSKMPPKLSLPHKRGLFLSSFKINPAVRVIARQVTDKNCLAAIFAPRHQPVSSGPLGCQGGTNVHLSNVHFVLRDISALLDPSWGS